MTINNFTLLNTIRRSRGFSRSVVYLVVIALISLVAERIIYYTLLDNEIIAKENAIEKINRVAPHKARLLGLPESKTQRQRQKEKSNDTRLSEAVISVQDTLDVLAFNLINKNESNKAQDKLVQLYRDLKEYDEKAITDFVKTEEHIKKHQLDDVIKQRHVDMVENYQREMKTFLENLNTIQSTNDTDKKLDAVLAARKQLEDKQLKRSPQPFDANDLPFKSAQPDKNNKPKTSVDEFAAAGLFNTPYQQYAALGDFTYDKLAGASNPEYLAESDEVVISDVIKAKAQELNYDPVKIYHWVRNNVEWLPNWGAMQDADITLGSRRGNAFDIASLTIALLRASQIPARYVHGTIDVSSDNFMNWAGGFSSMEAAADFVASGGIPSTSYVKDGKIFKLRLEHIWVEAAIDYQPSRGTINKDADSWVQLDTAYKTYDYLNGLDIASVTGIDSQELIDNFHGTGIVNDLDSWTQGLDSTVLLTAHAQSISAIDYYISNNNPDATVGETLGGRIIKQQEVTSLPSSLPYPIVVLGVRYDKIPSKLQYKGIFSLGKDILGQPLSQLVMPWSLLNNHKFTLSFKPATQADEDVVKSLFPQTDNPDLSQLPTTISAYLIEVIPELKLDGIVVGSGVPMALGADLELNISLIRPGRHNISTNSKIVSGSYIGIVTVGGSVSETKLNQMQSTINKNNALISAGDPLKYSTLNREDTMGNIFHSGILAYFTKYLALSYVNGLKFGVNGVLLPSSGTYGYVPKVNYFFGFPSSITNGGIEMDLGLISSFSTSKDNNNDRRDAYTLYNGIMLSTLEHSIPEQMLSLIDPLVEGVSAMKLLTKANDLNQKIYHIKQSNLASILPSLNLNSDDINLIKNSVNAGKEVIAHTDNINVNGWVGAGYIVMDKNSGDAAYLISGGLNGGFILAIIIGILLFLIGYFLFIYGAALLIGSATVTLVQGATGMIAIMGGQYIMGKIVEMVFGKNYLSYLLVTPGKIFQGVIGGIVTLIGFLYKAYMKDWWEKAKDWYNKLFAQLERTLLSSRELALRMRKG